MHSMIYQLVESSKFKNFILFVILVNGITMGIETPILAYMSISKMRSISSISLLLLSLL